MNGADPVGISVDRNLAPVHHLQQAGLGFGRGSVDLVRQDKVLKNWAGLKDKFTYRFVVCRHTGHVTRQQIAGKLDSG